MQKQNLQILTKYKSTNRGRIIERVCKCLTLLTESKLSIIELASELECSYKTAERYIRILSYYFAIMEDSENINKKKGECYLYSLAKGKGRIFKII